MNLRLLFFILISSWVVVSFSQLFAQPTNVHFRSNWDDASLLNQSSLVYNDLWGYVAADGREYAILGSRQYTHFIDVTDPDNPVEVAKELGGSNCIWRDYKVYGHYAYGVADNCNAGLEIFDLSNLPTSVQKVYDSNAFINDAHNIFIDTLTDKGKLYACGIDNDTTDIVILDLNPNPANSTLNYNLDLKVDGSDYIHDLYVRCDTAYLSNGNQARMLVYDLSDPGSKIFLGQISTAGYNHSSWVSDNGDVAVIADETLDRPLRVVDISDLDSPFEVSTIKSTLLAPTHTNSIAHNPFILGNDFVVISYYEDGLQIYKIDSTHKPFRAGYYDTFDGTSYNPVNGAWGTYPFLPSGNMLIADMLNGLFVVTPKFPLKDCQSDILVEGEYDNHWDYISADSFSSSAIYSSNADIIVRAPQSIDFINGFSIELGSVLEARIEDACASSSALKLMELRKP